MSKCQHFQDCEFILHYVAKVKPHWDDFVSLYCHGDFQDVCKRLEWITLHGEKPAPELMPTGKLVAEIMQDDEHNPA